MLPTGPSCVGKLLIIRAAGWGRCPQTPGISCLRSSVGRIGTLCYGGEDHVINNNETGDASKHLYDELTGIQYGTRDDRFGWVQSI